MRKIVMIAAIICGINLSTQAQVKVCMSYDDFAAGKWKRQSAANILPILVKKGLIEDYHHKEAVK